MIYALLASVLVGMTAIFLILAVARVANASTDFEKFQQEIDDLNKSELDLDRKPVDEINPKSWTGFWLRLYNNTGRIATSPAQPGRLAIIGALIMFGVGFLVWPRDVIAGIGFAAGFLVCLRIYFLFEAKRRMKTLEKQLPQLISGLRANLQASQTPQAALMNVAEEMPSPLGDELKALRNDIEVNVPLEEALDRMAQRVPSREIKFLVSAIQIAIASGADLDPQLIVIQTVIDNRTKMRQKLASAIAEVQPALLVSGIMIPAAFIFSLYSDPSNKTFWFSFNGLVAAGVVAALYAAGMLISKKLVNGVEKT